MASGAVRLPGGRMGELEASRFTFLPCGPRQTVGQVIIGSGGSPAGGARWVCM